MTTSISKTFFTPEELLLLPDAVNYELADGNLVERHMGSESSAIAMAIGALLLNFVKPKRLGHIFTADCGFQCFPGFPDKVRKPDVSFIRTGRLPGERIPQGHTRIAPDLVVEVVSPGDIAYEIDEKIQEYQSAQVPLIWIVSPKLRNVRIYRSPGAALGPSSSLTETETITGEEVLPGFSCAISEFFQI